ncbi:MAG: ComEC family competence protein [Lachnospiraceae bacterium]
MKQRPVACLALLVFLILNLLPPGLFYQPRKAAVRCRAQVTGRVIRQTEKNEKTQLYLKNCRVESENGRFQTDRMLVYLAEIKEFPLGSDLSLSGTVYPIEEPTNPGQFDSRLYYEQKGISSTFYAEHAQILSVHPQPVRQWLASLQKRLGSVYEQVLEEPDSGLLKAMVLGQKEELDAQIRMLYQRNGIAHLLAISGVKTLNLAIPQSPQKPVNWAFLRIHIAKSYIKSLSYNGGIFPRCRFPCSRGCFKTYINWQKE